MPKKKAKRVLMIHAEGQKSYDYMEKIPDIPLSPAFSLTCPRRKYCIVPGGALFN